MEISAAALRGKPCFSKNLLGLISSRAIKKEKARMFMWVGYSYDITVGRLSKISNGTHEIALKFCYIPIIPITKAHHPKWL